MPTDRLQALLASLREHQLLSVAKLDELTATLQPQFADAAALAQEMVRRGWLTPYQAKQLLEGQAHELTLGPYLLLEALDEGGMGEVFKALHRLMHRVVALKKIRPEHLPRPESVRRFLREMRALAQLSHPNIVIAHDADHVGDTYFLVMEYVAGTNLHKLVKQRGPLPVDRACDYVRQAALGLQHAHERGLVHRDIKPANLLLTSEGEVVKVLDLGLALIGKGPDEAEATATATSAPGAVMGTPDFMAPEQALGAHGADIRADIYSLGCTLYYLLTGRPPFAKGSAMEKLLLHQQAEPVAVELLRPEVPEPLAQVLRQMLAKQPSARYQTPAETAAALAPFCRADTGASSSPGNAGSGAAPARQAAIETLASGVLVNTESHPAMVPPAVSSRRITPGCVLVLAAVAGMVLLGVAAGVLYWVLPRPTPTTAVPTATPTTPATSVLVVAQQGGGDYTTIAEALKNAREKTRILVRPGLYQESLVIDRPVELVGDGTAAEVVVEATDATCLRWQAPSGLVRKLTFRSKRGPKGGKLPAVLISQGQPTFEECEVTSELESCVAIKETAANPTLRKCQIHGGRVAGIDLYDGGRGAIEDCDIFHNLVGVMTSSQGKPVIAGGTIRDNQAFGVFVRDKGQGTIHQDTVITGNAAAGVAIEEEGSYLLLQKCAVRNNGSNGIHVAKGATAKLYDCTIAGNADGGVVLDGKGTRAVIEYCRINKNKNTEKDIKTGKVIKIAAVTLRDQATARVEECDLRDNEGGPWWIEPGCVVEKGLGNNKE
jgi:serine/threonine protein kinase